MRSERNCSVYGCTNSYAKADGTKPLTLYSFPTGSVFRPWTLERRKVWITFVKRKTATGEDWQPTKNSRICNDHFLGGKKSEDPRSPSYNPTIHPLSRGTNPSVVSLDRYKRLCRRQNFRKEDSPPRYLLTEDLPDPPPVIFTKEFAVQTDENLRSPSKMTVFECQHINGNAATMVSHIQTEEITFANYAAGPSIRTPYFGGVGSVLNDGRMQEMTGISPNVFSLLLTAFPNHPYRVNDLDIKNKLLLTLMKLKSGLPLSTIGCLFGINRSAAAKIFISILSHLYLTTKDWIVFPSKFSVEQTMPAAFRDNYPSCRIIIDCTEVKTETPATVEQRVQMYSTYKSSYTAKYLIGITPSGLISFVSKGYGGRATDSFITNDCGVLDLLENGDTILADKGFPNVSVHDGITLIMPPFSKRNQKQFSPSQMEEAFKIASVRIHVERAIARLKIFGILNHKVTIDLLPKLDMIVRICALLVNLGPPLIKCID